jgi:hypothetical protein
MKNQKKAIEQKRVRLIAKGNFNRGIGMTVTSISIIEKIGDKEVCVDKLENIQCSFPSSDTVKTLCCLLKSGRFKNKRVKG